MTLRMIADHHAPQIYGERERFCFAAVISARYFRLRRKVRISTRVNIKSVFSLQNSGRNSGIDHVISLTGRPDQTTRNHVQYFTKCTNGRSNTNIVLPANFGALPFSKKWINTTRVIIDARDNDYRWTYDAYHIS